MSYNLITAMISQLLCYSVVPQRNTDQPILQLLKAIIVYAFGGNVPDYDSNTGYGIVTYSIC